MVSSDTESQIIFSKGIEIEVTSDEDGFRGAWYLATILESPPKSVSKKRKKALIEYKYLVTEDGSGPLTEYIDPGYIRPLPPQQEGGKDVFELNEVVEANYRDGWWTGTVRKVLDNGKFRVCFDNPPDVLDFEAKDLRLHYEWVNGNWVRAEKQQSTGSFFSPGTEVEVNVDDKESFRDVWFPAIVIKENADGTFFVKYQNSKNTEEAATVKVTLDSQHIRPTPPHYVDKNYELLERVDTSYGFGWRAGVITKVLAGRRYNVFFKQGNEDKELSHSEIRPHVEWTGGNWISKSKEILATSDNQEQLGHACNNSNNLEVTQKNESSSSAKDKSEDQTPCLANVRENQMEEQSTPIHEASAAHALPPSKKTKMTNANGAAVRSRPIKKLTKGNASDAPSSVTVRKMQNETAKEMDSGLATTKTDRTGTICSKKSVMVEQPSDKLESPFLGKRIKIKQQKFGVDFETVDSGKRRGRPTKLHIKSPQNSVTGKDITTTLAVSEEVTANDGKDKEEEKLVTVGLQAKGIGGTTAQNPYQISDKVSLKLIRDQKKSLNYSGGDDTMQPKGGRSSQRRKRGRPRKLLVVSPKAPEDGKELKGAAGAFLEVVKDHSTKASEFPSIKRLESTVHRDALGVKTSDILEVAGTTKEVDMAIAEVSNNMADDQPLSTWIGGMHSSNVEELRSSSGRTVIELNESREKQIDFVMKSDEIDSKGGSDAAENPILPFVKKSPIWAIIESFDAFQLMPQKPHFHPLSETKEEYREGSAVGIMVTYAGLFEKISMMQVDDSRSIFDRTLESLLDLERHGFDVTMLRGRVNELLLIRDRQGQLADELNNAEKEIIERNREKRNLGEEIEEIKKKISEMEEQLDSTKLRKQTVEYEVSRLQLIVDDINKRVQSARQDFGKVAATPWKSS